MGEPPRAKLEAVLVKWITERGPLKAGMLAQLASTPRRHVERALRRLVESGVLIVARSADEPAFDLASRSIHPWLESPAFPDLDWVEIEQSVRATLRSKRVHGPDLDDLTQETLLQVALSGRPRHLRNPKAYTKGVALNVHAAWCRRRMADSGREVPFSREPSAPDRQPAEGQPRLKRWLERTFLPALRKRLTLRQRQVLAGRLKGLTDREIARTLHMDVANVRRTGKSIEIKAKRVKVKFPPPSAVTRIRSATDHRVLGWTPVRDPGDPGPRPARARRIPLLAATRLRSAPRSATPPSSA